MIEHVIEGCQCEGKRCKSCPGLKCTLAFYKHKNFCKVCILAKGQKERDANPEKYREQKRIAYQNNPQKYRQRSKEWREKHPDEDKVINRRSRATHIEKRRSEKRERYAARDADFKKQEQERIKAYYLAHPEKNREQHAHYYQANADKVNARVKAHRQSYPERYVEKARIRHNNRRTRKTQAGGSYTFEEWQGLKSYYNYTCLCCGKSEPEIKLTADHVIPVSKSGTSYIENIQPLCLACNVKKHNRIIDYRTSY